MHWFLLSFITFFTFPWLSSHENSAGSQHPTPTHWAPGQWQWYGISRIYLSKSIKVISPLFRLVVFVVTIEIVCHLNGRPPSSMSSSTQDLWLQIHQEDIKKQNSRLFLFLLHLKKVFSYSGQATYESFATVGEFRVWWRADFQSGSRVLKKVFWTFLIYIYGIQCDFMPKSCWKHSNFEFR